MTEEIKKLIEEESIEYAQIISERISLTNRVNSSDFALAVKHGANLILSKWQEAERWRKVEEELPDHKKTPYPINIRNIGRPMSVSTWNIRDESDIQILERMKGCEWKPIS